MLDWLAPPDWTGVRARHVTRVPPSCGGVLKEAELKQTGDPMKSFSVFHFIPATLALAVMLPVS